MFSSVGQRPVDFLLMASLSPRFDCLNSRLFARSWAPGRKAALGAILRGPRTSVHTRSVFLFDLLLWTEVSASLGIYALRIPLVFDSPLQRLSCNAKPFRPCSRRLRFAIERQTSGISIVHGLSHLRYATRLIASRARCDKITDIVISFVTVDVIDVHIIPGDYCTTPMTSKRTGTMLIEIHDTVLILIIPYMREEKPVSRNINSYISIRMQILQLLNLLQFECSISSEPTVVHFTVQAFPTSDWLVASFNDALRSHIQPPR